MTFTGFLLNLVEKCVDGVGGGLKKGGDGISIKDCKTHRTIVFLNRIDFTVVIKFIANNVGLY